MSRIPKKKKVMKPVYIIIAALFMLACTTDKSMEINRQELIEADKAFSKLSSDEGMKSAFLSYCASEGVMLTPESMPVVGYEAVENLIGNIDDSAIKLTWEPLYALAAKSGEMGYTYGIFSRYIVALDSTLKGTYVSIWIKEDGEWKFVLDSGNEGVGE